MSVQHLSEGELEMAGGIPTGPFTCDLTIHRVKAPEFVRENRDGVTYLSAEGYELAYETVFGFNNGSKLHVKGKVFGEVNKQVVIRSSDGKPLQLSGWIQGSIELQNQNNEPIFKGTYYDVDLVIELTGDEDLTPKSLRLTHWEHAFGAAEFLGHAFSMKVDMTRDLDSGALVGPAKGRIV